MKTLRLISRILIGLVFIFSGYVKAIDPTGSQLIFTEYFKAFHLGFMIPAAMPIGILLSTAELTLGLCLLLGLRMKLTAWATALFMGFFTILTFILAVFSPVSDCGCFGEAIKLTNWQTFFKNIIIDAFVVVVFMQRNAYTRLSTCRNEFITAGVFTALSLTLSIYCYRHLPLIDFLPYKVGVNITQAMEIPEDAKRSVYETLLVYEKQGEGRKTFTLADYPQNDTAWKFVESKSILKEKGYEPSITDFTVSNASGDYITDSVLNLRGYLFILTLPHAEEASLAHAANINSLAEYAALHRHIHFIALSGSADDRVAEFTEKTGSRYPIYFTDEKPLKGMVRANPGLLLLYNGTIVEKWSHYDIPNADEMAQTVLSENPDILIARHLTCIKMAIEIKVVLLFVLLIMLTYCFRKYGKQNK
ncbi:MAG: DoxX family membrane protein [Prevotellaceae bacterium]|jgi:uncharacterized membrane protein YphA (DoxX/SURF4 family)|nr:DoxX family membrane protein [Prevotellaceae bacterium]